jgi:hypothetical protein
VPAKQRAWSLKIRADETARFRAGIFRLKTSRVDRKGITRSLARSGGTLRANGTAKAYWTTRAKFRSRALKPGWYVYGVRLTAETSAKRVSTLVGRPFRVGNPS